MREVKFRGLRTDTNEWVYGSLLQSEIDVNKLSVKCAIVERFVDSYRIVRYEVIPESVMQYTGLKDKNGVEIYESDLLINPKKEIGVVEWDESGFHLRCERKNNSIFLIPLTHGFLLNKEVVGNIHQNPELL